MSWSNRTYMPLLNYEHHIFMPDGINARQLLPTNGDFKNFYDAFYIFLGEPLNRNHEFFDTLQLFVDWLILLDSAADYQELACRVYNIRHYSGLPEDPYSQVIDFQRNAKITKKPPNEQLSRRIYR